MRLIILHGNGFSAISGRLSLIKEEFDSLSVTEINCKEVGLGQALAQVSTQQFFSDKRLVILEEIEPSADLSKLTGDENLTLVLKFSKGLVQGCEVLKSTAFLSPQIILLSEKDETNIFPFLDMLAEKKTEAFNQLGQFLGEWGGQYVLTMIFYMLRRLILPVKQLPPFVVKKIEIQKKNFSLEKITEIYKFALETDFKLKNGLTEERLGLTLLVEKIMEV